MKSRRRSISRILLLSFVLRALIPAGLMLQLPALGAATFSGDSGLGFVICPLQNPGIDLSKLNDSTPDHNPHAHHGHLADGGETTNAGTMTATSGESVCSLLAASALATISFDREPAFYQRLAPTEPIADEQHFLRINQFSPRLTRAPPSL